MKRILTLVSEWIIMLLAGETEAGSVEVQPARDSRFMATNCRWDGGLLSNSSPIRSFELHLNLYY